MPDIKLFVCCHQPTPVPAHPLLIPIQVGAALAEKHFLGFIYDDRGDNISRKNRSYCELTAQYWAWKNIDADYYGFFHYRRYLYPDQQAKRPYRIKKAPSFALLEHLNYLQFAELITQYDLILPMGENMHIPVRNHYSGAPFHHAKDMALVERITQELYPDYRTAVHNYLDNTICYFGNIYIMKKQVFQNYCGWLFPILEEFDRRADTCAYSLQEQRVDGYLAERLLGVYATYQRQANRLHITELPRVHFVPNAAVRWQKQIVGLIFPPGSTRRAFWKSVAINGR